MPGIEPTPVSGKAKVTLHLDELHAIKNPELIGKAEWALRLWINSIERWRSDSHISIADGSTVPVGAEIVTDVDPNTSVLELKVQATERDPLNSDDHASGE